MSDETIILIAGPTASGKSATAIKLARDLGGEIVNADAMQVYGDLATLTARPTPADEACAPHHLYGVMDGAERCSAGRWGRMAAGAIGEITKRERRAIIVGGTGLYFRALVAGLSPVPETPPDIRAAAAARRAALGPAAFRDEVIGWDPAMTRFPEGDAQRLSRAWEVFKATGKTLSHFQSMPGERLVAGASARVIIAPPRAALYAACDRRAEAMFNADAVEEVRNLLARGLDPALPVMKALGVAEIGAFLRGESDRESALQQLQQNTRRFAKRQLTWFRRQTADWPQTHSPESAVGVLKSQIGQ